MEDLSKRREVLKWKAWSYSTVQFSQMRNEKSSLVFGKMKVGITLGRTILI